MRKVLSIVLILAGIAIGVSPFVGRYYVKYQQDKMYKEYLAQLETKNEELCEALHQGVEEQPLDEAKDKDKGKLDASKIKGAIGLLKIPKIDVWQVIIEGSDNYALRYGVGHVTDTAFPGENGNAVLAGHRNGTWGTYFSRLGDLEIGDQIICEYNGKEFEYKVKESFIVKPTDVYVLEGKDTEQVMTLITCHPRGKDTHRLIVRANLVK